MITMELNVRDYCQDCYLFEPTSDLVKSHNNDGTRNNQVIISCTHKPYCDRLCTHMKNVMKKQQGAKIDSPIIE